MLVTGEPDLDRLMALAPILVDDTIGVIREVRDVPRRAGEPDFFHVSAAACDTSAFARAKNFAASGGAAITREVAAAKAIGEAVERYCAAIFDMEALPLFTYDDAPYPAAAPREFALFSAEQYASSGFPWAPFESTTSVRWREMVDATTGQACHVPAAMVYVPYHYYRGTGDCPITQPISTGLACHTSTEAAIASAIAEVVERDAFMITWQAGMAPPRVRVETLSDENYDLVARFERTGATVTVLDITLDNRIPTILSVLTNDDPNSAAMVVAASAAVDPETAIRKSLEELAHTRRYSQEIFDRLPRLSPDDLGSVVDQISHLNYWADHANTAKARFLFSCPTRLDFEELSSPLPAPVVPALVGAIQSTGHRVLLADLTTPDVRSLGLHVVRAIVPGYHPLFMGHELRALGGTRLVTIPQRLGHHGVAPGQDINLPHPYP